MFRFPVLAGLRNDGLVAVWGERTDSVHRAPGTDPSDIARIVAADYRGGAWSKPTVLAQASGIGWNSISISNAVATKRGTIHVAVPAYRHLQTEFLLVLSYSAGRWRTREIPKRAGAVYATLAVRNDSLLMAFASPATDGVADISSIWFASSADDGLTWGTPRLLRRSGLVPAYDVKIVSGPSGPITIVWRQIDREELAEYFWAIRSHDGGRTWTAPTKWAAPNGVARVYSAIASEKGAADLMYASNGGAQLDLVRACADGSWRHAPASPDSLKPANGAAFIEESDGSRGIVWSVIVPIWPPFRQWLYTAVR
jgi:hypothetical protein